MGRNRSWTSGLGAADDGPMTGRMIRSPAPAAGAAPGLPGAGRPALVALVLVLLAVESTAVASLGTPLLPTIQASDHVSLAASQWALTIALLTGAVTTPVLGRLGDGRRRRAATIAAVAVMLAGCDLVGGPGRLRGVPGRAGAAGRGVRPGSPGHRGGQGRSACRAAWPHHRPHRRHHRGRDRHRVPAGRPARPVPGAGCPVLARGGAQRTRARCLCRGPAAQPGPPGPRGRARQRPAGHRDRRADPGPGPGPGLGLGLGPHPGQRDRRGGDARPPGPSGNCAPGGP